MTRLLCVKSGCRRRGWHNDDCANDQCRGCQPWPAADGLNLCEVDTRRLGEDAMEAARLYDELGNQLTAGGGWGQRTSGSREPGLRFNARVADARNTVRQVLVGWARVVSEERGVGLPADDNHAIAAYLALHAQWLAAHPAAKEAADELREAAHGEPLRVARPSGARVMALCPCPRPECPGDVHAIIRPDDPLLPRLLRCDEDEEHVWPAERWREFEGLYADAGIVSTAVLAARLGKTPSAIRLLVHQGVISPVARYAEGPGRPTMWFLVTEVDARLAEATKVA